ncbi:MAG: radical SAM protein [Candidatus Ventricola sp.]
MDSLDAFSGTYNERLINKAQQQKIPISGTFELSPVCNMRCRMCYIEHVPRREELQPYEFWIEIFEQAIQMGMLFPLLTGGEPFLYPDFDKLYERLTRLPLHLCINTNATLLDRERVAWLAKYPPRRLNISLYGASDETYAKLCGNPNGFSQVMNAFDLLKEYDIAFRVHSVMVPENAADYRQIIEICNRYQVPLAIANYMLPSYRKEEDSVQAKDRFPPIQLAERSLAYLRDHFIGQEEEYRLYLEQRCAAFERPERYSLYGNNQVTCRAGSCVFWVDWRGCASGCGIHNQNRIDLHTTAFADAWKKIVEDTNHIRISEKCKCCRYRCICHVCAAAAFCETGSMAGTPEYLCAFCEEYAKLLLAERSSRFGKL